MASRLAKAQLDFPSGACRAEAVCDQVASASAAPMPRHYVALRNYRYRDEQAIDRRDARPCWKEVQWQ